MAVIVMNNNSPEFIIIFYKYQDIKILNNRFNGHLKKYNYYISL